MANPKITIVTVVLNDAKNIESTVNSVLSQTYQNIEYIIIDGKSNDGTVEILNCYKKQLSHFISESDGGIYDAMNKGTQLASGDWIIYLNSGDQMHGMNILENIFFNNEKQIQDKDIIYSDVIVDNKITRKASKAKNIVFFWRGMPFSHQACFVKTTLAKSNPFNLEYGICADYDFYYHLFKNKARFYYSEFPISVVDVTTGISKEANLKILYSEFFKICKKYSSGGQLILTYFISLAEYVYAQLRRYYISKFQ